MPESSRTVEIYFNDISEAKQKQLLEIFNVDSPSQMNWDVFPVAVISAEEPDFNE